MFDLKPHAFWLAGTTVYSALKLEIVYALSLERPADILAEASKKANKSLADYLAQPENRTAEAVLRCLLAGAINRRKSVARDPEGDEALHGLEAARELFRLAGASQAFVSANWTRIQLVANTLMVDRVVPANSLRWILNLPKKAAA